jgi:hypothetical protein
MQDRDSGLGSPGIRNSITNDTRTIQLLNTCTRSTALEAPLQGVSFLFAAKLLAGG